jgi:tripartite-type tricarboxylate transporter receptor subunit TctC
VLQRETKQPFVVENRTGAGGNIGADYVAKAAADGYTMLIGLDTSFTVNPLIYKSMPFKNGDLRPVMVFASQGMLMAVSPKTNIKTLEQFIARGKDKGLTRLRRLWNPGHLASSILTYATGAKVNHVPYKGNAPATLAMLSGEVDGGVISSTAMLLPHVTTGKDHGAGGDHGPAQPLAAGSPLGGRAGTQGAAAGSAFRGLGAQQHT